MRWGDVTGSGKKQLVVAPLQGRGTKGPNWGEGRGVRVLVYTVPDDPAKAAWKYEVADDSLHTTHNLQLVDWDGDGRDEIVIAGWEGRFRPEARQGRTLVEDAGRRGQPGVVAEQGVERGQGRQARQRLPIRRHGRALARQSGRRLHDDSMLADAAKGLLHRTVIDEPVQWGHAVWCADLDGDGDDELIIGQRDKSNDPKRTPTGPGVLVYDPGWEKPGDQVPTFTRHVIDDGGIGCEDLVAADLDGDGRLDILAGGRSTHNVMIYWNKAGR